MVHVGPGDLVALGVGPEGFSRLGVDRLDRHAVCRPDAGAEVENAVLQHRAPARGRSEISRPLPSSLRSAWSASGLRYFQRNVPSAAETQYR